MAKSAKARDVRELPEFVAFKPAKDGVMSVVDGTHADPAARIPADASAIAMTIHKMLTHKVTVNQYAFFCPKYAADGSMVYARGKDGQVILTKSGRAQIEQIDLARAIKEVEEGKRVATLSHAKYGTFRVSLLAAKSAKGEAKQATGYFDVAAFFAAKK